jgi:hypothetical protein
MAFILPATLKVFPSYTEPGLILQYAQASGAFGLLGGGKPSVRLSDGDLAVYVHRLDLRTRTAAGQSGYNNLPTAEIVGSYGTTPTYLLQMRSDYNHHDTAAAGRWNLALPEAVKLALQQGHVQSLRLMLLYGMQPSNGEGLLNTAGATSTTLGSDSLGSSTLTTWDNGELFQYFLQVMSDIITRTNQVGLGSRIAICMPQRVYSNLAARIVQLTANQRAGAGTANILRAIEDNASAYGLEVEWLLDDTLINKGAGGTTDAILFVMPEVKKPTISGLNTNMFAEIEPGLNAVTVQYTDRAAPTEIMSPLVGGATDVLTELRATSGVAWRGEAVTILSAAYS